MVLNKTEIVYYNKRKVSIWYSKNIYKIHQYKVDKNSWTLHFFINIVEILKILLKNSK